MGVESLQRFHNDIRAALIAGVPLVGDDDRLTLKKLDDLEESVSNIGSEARSSDGLQAKIQEEEQFPAWYRAAVTVYSQSDSTIPVLEGLSVRPAAIEESCRALRWSFVYLLIVLATALLGTWLFYTGAGPAFELFQEDLKLPSAINDPDQPQFQPWVFGFLIVIGVVFAFGLIWMCVGGISKLTMILGGRQYVDFSVSETVLRIAAVLNRTGLSTKQAIDVCCELTSASPEAEQIIQSLTEEADNASEIGSLADCLSIFAHKKLFQLKLRTPALLIAVIGGSLAFVYCLMVFLPILYLLKELPEAGL